MSLKINTVYGRRHSKLFTNCHVTHVQTIPSSEKKENKSSCSSIQYSVQKKARSCKNSSSCKVANYKESKKTFFFLFFQISRNMIEQEENEEQNIEMSKYFHLISYKYLKNIVKLN